MENHLTIAVCDDIAADRAELCSMTGAILRDCGIMSEIMEYTEGKDLLSDIENGKQFQILILDAILNDMSGLDLAAVLRQQRNNVEIIFVSANRELAMGGL